MARFQSLKRPNNRMARNVQVANRIQNFVSDKFIWIAQTLWIQHIKIINHNRIGQIATQAQIVAAHQFHFLHKAKSAGAGNLFQIGSACKINAVSLIGAIEHRVIKIDG